MALANQPPLLLADEPTGELDAIGADSVYEVLGDLNARYGVTVIIVTHDPEIASRVDRVVAIRDGRTSMEIFRRVEQTGGVTHVVHDEYVLVDSAGRLQVPREFLDRLSISERAKLFWAKGASRCCPTASTASARRSSNGRCGSRAA